MRVNLKGSISNRKSESEIPSYKSKKWKWNAQLPILKVKVNSPVANHESEIENNQNGPSINSITNEKSMWKWMSTRILLLLYVLKSANKKTLKIDVIVLVQIGVCRV